MKKVSMCGPLPPIKGGISEYTKSLVSAMEQHIAVQFLGYDAMYPDALYPGGAYKDDTLLKPKLHNTNLQESINRYNPLSWIKAGVDIDGDVLHIQYWIRFLSPIVITIDLIARYIHKIPVVMTIHNVIPHEISFRKLWIDKLVYKTATSFVVHSQKNKEDLIEIVGSKKSVEVIPMGILPISTKKISKQEARTQLDIGQDRKVLLAVGNIRAYKGLDVTINILSELVKNDGDYLLIIAGKCREERSKYQTQIDALGMQDHILRIPGFLSEEQMNQVFCASDIQMLTYTHFDAQSAALATGLGFDIPMIVSDFGGLTDVIDAPEYVIDIQDAHGSAHKIISVIDDLDRSIHYIQQRKKHFSWDVIALDTIAYYSTLFG